jgi:hypothetical protein
LPVGLCFAEEKQNSRQAPSSTSLPKFAVAALLFLPGEIFHDFTGENLLYRALRRSGVLFFNWDKRRVGGNGTVRQVLIDHLRNVPDTKVKSLARTSGGAPVLPMPDGYIFTDNPERSDEGAFSAMIQLYEDISSRFILPMSNF